MSEGQGQIELFDRSSDTLATDVAENLARHLLLNSVYHINTWHFGCA